MHYPAEWHSHSVVKYGVLSQMHCMLMRCTELYLLTIVMVQYRCIKWLHRINGSVVAHPSWKQSPETVPPDSPFAKHFDEVHNTCFNIQCTVHVQKNFYNNLVPSVIISGMGEDADRRTNTIKINISLINQLRKAFYRGVYILFRFLTWMLI